MAQLRMNIIINIKFSANVLPLTIFALFAYSCTKENETTGARIYEGEKIPMSIKMGARNTTADDDENPYAQLCLTTKTNWYTTMFLMLP